MALKHVGRLKKNKRKLIVAYRVVPGDTNHCVCVTTENLDAADHDTLMTLVESNAGQTAFEFAEVMARARLSDGSNMLARFHTTGKMAKFLQTEVEMTPDSNTTIGLDELNKVIADQKGVSIADLALTNPQGDTAEPVTTDPVEAETPTVNANTDVLSDDDLAANYRSQADRMFKEAKRLREQAEELAPTKKKKTATQSA